VNALPADPRQRNLILLGGIAVLALVLALLAVWAQSGSGNAPKQSELFPGLATRVAHHEVTHIHIESKANGVVDVAFRPQTGWVVASRGNYPASFEQVNGTLVGLAAMQILEPKTSKPEWLHYVGLDAPPKGDGVLVRVSDEHGKTLAALIAGKTSDIGDPTGATGLFARKEGGDQSWLVRSVNEIRSAPAEWMEKSVLDVDRARIREVDVTPVGSPAYSVQRVKPSDPDFTLAPIPEGREIADPTARNGAAEAIVGFSFDDARRASDLDFTTGTSKLVTKTFDGLVITVTTIRKGGDAWATIAAESDGPKAAKEARDINARAAGWAYKLAQYKGAQFTTPLENLLKPVGPPAKTAP
jgi:hypothetical protein